MLEKTINSVMDLETLLSESEDKPVTIRTSNGYQALLVPFQLWQSLSEDISAEDMRAIEKSPNSPLQAAVGLLIKESQGRAQTEQAILDSEKQFLQLFNHSLTPMRTEDWSGVKEYLIGLLKSRPIVDLYQFLICHPHEVRCCLSKVSVTNCNDAFLDLLDARQEPDYPRYLDNFIPEECYHEVAKLLSSIVENQSLACGQFNIRRMDGGIRNMQFQFTPMLGFEHSLAKVIVTFLDITEQKRLEHTLQQKSGELEDERERVQLTLNNIREGVITTDVSGLVIGLNPTAQKLTGWHEGFQGVSIDTVFSPQTVSSDNLKVMFEACKERMGPIECDTQSYILTKDGGEIWVTYSVTPIITNSGSITGFLIIFHDVSESRGLLERIRVQSSRDQLTNLFNRQEFEKHLTDALNSAKLKGHTHSLLYLDLDQFKVVNDTCSHSAGDELLRQVARLLLKKVRTDDIIARMGGDEFAVLLKTCNETGALKIAQSIHKDISAYRFNWESKTFSVGASIGIVPINANISNVEDLLSYADSAVYVAKDSGRNRVQLYDEKQEVLAQQQEQLHYIAKINHALDNNRMVLSSQIIAPIVKNSEEGTHYELLIRMIDEDGKVIQPGDFLPAAERYNLMPKIDRWVVENAFQWLSVHGHKKGAIGLCSINLSGHSLGEESFFDFVEEQFTKFRVPGERICFEITESMAIYNLSKTLEFIDRFRSRGCKFSLDDFGSGFSSYGYLKSLPVDFLKIDGSFVRQMADDPIDYAMVKSINEVGHVMNRKTIAEFVENERTLEMLREIGVDYAQGYGIAKPELLFELPENKRSA